MQKFYSFLLILTVLIVSNCVSGQSVLNPADPVITYNQSSPPAQPTWGQIGKWVRTKRLGWNTDSYKAYIYKGCAFRLKFPKTYNPTANDGKKYPMLVFFHGLGETGSIYDNEYQLYHGGDNFAAAVDNGTFDGYILCMQSQGFWGAGQYQYIAEIIDYMVANNKLDPFRVSDNGLSAGGQGTWEMMFNYPAYIAAAIPMSSVSIGYKDASNVNKAKFTPIWLVQGGKDGSPAPPTAQQVRDAFVAAGGNFTYTEYPDLGHGVWDRLWTEPDFFPYILRAYGSNPWPLTGRMEFCPNDNINVTLGLSTGFNEYQWRKDGNIISGATSNSITVTSTGTYDARVRRGSIWSDWSHTPVVIKTKTPTVPPTITAENLSSPVIPAPDGRNYVNLQVPNNYVKYKWVLASDTATSIGNQNVLNVTQPGNYAVSVGELYGCASVYSAPFKVVNANGANGPDAATSLTALTLSNTKVQLDWSDKPNQTYNETAFEIYRSTKSGSSYAYIGSVPADAVTFTDSAALPNTTYYYVVRAINNNAASGLSNEASATTLTDNIPPTAPGNLRVVLTTSTSVSIAWDPATDNIGISRYDIFVNGLKTYTTDKTSFIANGLDNGKQYVFYVKARDISGNYSTQSNQVSAFAALQGLTYKYYEGNWSALPDFNTLTPVKTGISKNFDLSVRNRDDQFGIVWQGYIKVPVAGTYKFETYSDDGSKLWLGTYNAAATPLVDNDGLHGVQYKSGTVTLQPGIYPISAAFFEQGGDQVMQVYWTCSALYGDNNRHQITDNYFADNTGSAGSVPAMPTNLIATALDYNRIKLTWTDNSNNESVFEIYRATSQSGPYEIIKTVAANVTSYTDSALNAATTYYYKVNAVNNAGSSSGGGGLKYSYYTGQWNNLPDFNNLTPSKTGTVNNITLSVATSTTNYAIKFEGYINIPVSGQYTFYTKSDDGSKLYIGGFDAAHQVVNNDYLQSATERSGTVTLSAGIYPIYITFFQKGGDYVLQASYQGPSIAKTLIPDAAFTVPPASAKTANLPGAPAKATNVTAVVQSSSVIALTWNDNATNETAYKVYRSINDSLNFKLRSTLPANSTAYNDSSLFAHTTYYYKILTVGVAGTSSQSAVVFKTTTNNFPVLNEIESRSVRYDITTTIPVSATDVDNDSLAFSFINKPTFVTSQVNGRDAIILTFKPKAAQQGVYNNFKIVVNDRNGGKDTTDFTFTVNDNYDPSIDFIPDCEVVESGNLIINLNGHDQNTGDSLSWTVTNAPDNFTIVPVDKLKAQLQLHPTYGAAGSYIVNVKANDGNGGFTTRTFNINVTDKDPNFNIYARFKLFNDPGDPWNSITGLQTNNLKNDKGNTTNVGFNILTNWFGTEYWGSPTGDNSGVYPDAVLNDYYFVGLWAGADTARMQITNLDTSLRYNLTLLASSIWPGVTNNGSTVFTSGDQTVSLNVQGNTKNTVTLTKLKPDASGSIYFTMKKGTDAARAFLNSVVINSLIDDGTAPLAPKSLTVEDSTNGVILKWNDVSYNEDNFRIYRSLSETSTYTLLATVGVNKTSYLDTSAHGNVQYYYKILASNSTGNSAYSNIASILTDNKIPVLAGIDNVIIKNNTQLTIPVVATDDVTDYITLTVAQLPSFVTFTNNGNGTGSLVVKPISGTTGYYPGITITAKDNSGATSTVKFDITVTDANSTSVYLNFTDVANQANKPWNNLTGFPFAATVFNNIKDDNGNATAMSVTLVDGFSAIAAEGMRPGNDHGIYPYAVTRTAEIEGSTTTKTIKITGLSTSKKYNFVFFNSHQDGLKGTTNFTINGQTVSLDAAYNINKTVQINGITPDANGQVSVLVAKATGADYAYISSLIIQTYDQSISLINPAGLTVTENKRTSISLRWADQSNNETGFEVWRADSSNGSYHLISTLAANTTVFTDLNLTQNKTYYYAVRAINGGGKSAFSNVAIAYTLAYATYVNFTIDSIAKSPWYNTIVPPQRGYTWTNFMDEANNPTSMTMTEVDDFAGAMSSGVVTGNNSGIYPDAVIYQSYGLFPGQSATLKLSNLNLNMNYDITFFASSQAWGDVTVAYTVNGKTVLLNVSLNTKGTVTAYGIKPDDNGEITITIAPGTSTSQYGMISAMVVQAYSDPVSTLPSSLPQQQSAIALASAAKITDVSVNEQKRGFDNLAAYPNPFVSNFTLSFSLPVKDNVEVEIYDLSGKLLYQNRFLNLFKGNNSVTIKPRNSLSSGMYIVKLTALNSKTSETIRITKQY